MKKFFFAVWLIFFAICSSKAQTNALVATWNLEAGFVFPELREDWRDSMAVAFENLGMICTVDSMIVDDPDPTNINAVPYLVFLVHHNDSVTKVGVLLYKSIDSETRAVDYILDPQRLDEDDDNIFARGFKCTNTPCDNESGCKIKRQGFLGLGGFHSCPCRKNEQISCLEEQTGQSFPWAAVLSFAIGVASLIVTLTK